MKTFQAALLTVLVAAGLASCATEQQGAKPGAMVVEVVEWSGTVTAVDYVKRTVTLREPGGKIVTLNAKNARNLDQVKVGDVVNAEYIEELAIFVRKADSPPSATEAQVIELAPKGQKPAGNIRTFKVSDSVQNFQQIKKGDQVVLQYMEAFALAVVKP